MKSIKPVFFKMIMLTFFVFGSTGAFSQLSGNDIKTNAENNVQFLGIVGDYLVFDLRLSELLPKGCTITIMDEPGNLYFEEVISGNLFTRRYKVSKEGITRIRFKASGRGFLFHQSFTIKKEERLIVIAD